MRVAHLGHRTDLPRLARSRRRARRRAGEKGARLAGAEANPRRARRLDRAAASICAPAAGRSNTPMRIIPMSTTPPLSPWRWTGCRGFPATRNFAPRSSARANGSSACRAKTAPGARSMPTTNSITSTTFRSPITARCSIRRPRTSPRAACRCWRSSARPRRTARLWRAGSIICAARSSLTEAGSAAGG